MSGAKEELERLRARVAELEHDHLAKHDAANSSVCYMVGLTGVRRRFLCGVGESAR